MQEPVRLSLTTGEPHKDNIKHYPLPSIEQELWDTIQEQKNERENNQTSNKD